MKKGLLTIIAAISMIYLVMSVTIAVKYTDANNKIEQKDNKIEALQEENATLHDDIWNLNQHLMKEGAE